MNQHCANICRACLRTVMAMLAMTETVNDTKINMLQPGGRDTGCFIPYADTGCHTDGSNRTKSAPCVKGGYKQPTNFESSLQPAMPSPSRQPVQLNPQAEGSV